MQRALYRLRDTHGTGISFPRTAYATYVILISVLPQPHFEAFGLPPLGGLFFDPVRRVEWKKTRVEANYYGVVTMISNYLHYQYALLLLMVKRDIDVSTWRYAAWHRPIVVCGRAGSQVVDTPPEALNSTHSHRMLVQFFVGMLMIAGAVGWTFDMVEGADFSAILILALSQAAWVVAFGLLLVLDAMAASIYRWVSIPGHGGKACRLPIVEPEESSC